MRRSILAVLLLAGLVLAACAKKSSLYLDSGQPQANPPPPKTAPTPAPPATPSSQAK